MSLDQDKKVLNELNDALAQAQTVEAEKLPKEHLSDFSTDSMTYLDISAAILDQTENLFQVTGECNRFAPEYLTYCKTLITAVNHLGSAFITKTAMHCRDNRPPSPPGSVRKRVPVRDTPGNRPRCIAKIPNIYRGNLI